MTKMKYHKPLALNLQPSESSSKKYETGEEELKTQKRGLKVSHRKGLSHENEAEIRSLLVKKIPDQPKKRKKKRMSKILADEIVVKNNKNKARCDDPK